MAVIILAVVMRPVDISPPPDKKPPTFVTLAAAPPPNVEPVPPKNTQRPTPRQPETRQPAAVTVSIPSRPSDAPAPIEAPKTLPTQDIPSTVSQLTTNVDLPPAPVLAPVPASDPGLVSEVPVTDFDQRPVLIKKVEPVLPLGATGKVTVEVTVLTTGRVSRVKVLSPTPYEAAIATAASQCVFQAGRRRGRPVTVIGTIDFTFDTRK